MKTLRQRCGLATVAPIYVADDTPAWHTGWAALSDPDDDKVPDRSTNPL